MAKFDHFSFMRDRSYGREPTEDELREFNYFMCTRVLSMDSRYVAHVDALNTSEFAALPKPTQCLAFTAFDGVKLDMSWKMTSKGTKKPDEVDDVTKIMKVYNLSNNDAVSCVKFKTVDMEEVDDLYLRLFDAGSAKFRAKKGKKRKKSGHRR